MTTFISNINNAFFLPPILLNQTLIVEIKPDNETSFFIEISSQGASLSEKLPQMIDFKIEGKSNDLEEVLLNAGKLKQFIAAEKIKIQGSYRNFLKLEAIITLS
jgi:hypothetical protein